MKGSHYSQSQNRLIRLYTSAKVAKCKYCQASVLWVRSQEALTPMGRQNVCPIQLIHRDRTLELCISVLSDLQHGKNVADNKRRRIERPDIVSRCLVRGALDLYTGHMSGFLATVDLYRLMTMAQMRCTCVLSTLVINNQGSEGDFFNANI
jgi:hypothetical protein